MCDAERRVEIAGVQDAQDKCAHGHGAVLNGGNPKYHTPRNHYMLTFLFLIVLFHVVSCDALHK